MNRTTRQTLEFLGFDGVKDSRAKRGGKRRTGFDRDAAKRERRKGY